MLQQASMLETAPHVVNAVVNSLESSENQTPSRVSSIRFELVRACQHKTHRRFWESPNTSWTINQRWGLSQYPLKIDYNLKSNLKIFCSSRMGFTSKLYTFKLLEKIKFPTVQVPWQAFLIKTTSKVHGLWIWISNLSNTNKTSFARWNTSKTFDANRKFQPFDLPQWDAIWASLNILR